MTAWAETALRRLADRRALRAIQNPACMKDTPEICLGLAINPESVKIRSRLPVYHNREVSSRNAVGVALSLCGHLGHRCEDAMGPASISSASPTGRSRS